MVVTMQASWCVLVVSKVLHFGHNLEPYETMTGRIGLDMGEGMQGRKGREGVPFIFSTRRG